MKRSIIEIMFRMCLSAVSLPGVAHAMAQDCQVVTSRPEIQLGNKLYAANSDSLFTQQILTLTAICSRAGPVSVRVGGTPDDSGKHFRFGARGRMELTLLSAQYSNTEAILTLISPDRGVRRFIQGQAEPLSPGSQITLRRETDVGPEPHPLILQIRLDFPASGDEGQVRERTEMDGQLQFEATQME
ncbi:hypothetical protein ACED16_19010 [Enterobacter hormaechei]